MTAGATRQRSRALRVSLALAAGLMFAGFFALGTWQIYRLQWKLALIERVELRVRAAPQPAPGVADWPRVNAEADDYRHVTLSGVYLPALTTRTLASTARGVGYWVLTPLCVADGSIVMINRGFVAAGTGGWEPQALPAPAPADACAVALHADPGPVAQVSGLLRLSEAPQSLRPNEPARNFWYTRDLNAIALARGLPAVAPYYVDADADADAGAPANAAAAVASSGSGSVSADGRPVGGMTVVSFPNNHLVYAVTWYALALMIGGAAVWVARDARKGN